MSPTEPWSDADISDLRMHWADHTPVHAIATHLNRTESSVWAMVRMLGLQSRKLNFIGSDGERIATLYNGTERMSYTAISHAIGISRQAGARRIHTMLEYGLLKPRGRK